MERNRVVFDRRIYDGGHNQDRWLGLHWMSSAVSELYDIGESQGRPHDWHEMIHLSEEVIGSFSKTREECLDAAWQRIAGKTRRFGPSRLPTLREILQIIKRYRCKDVDRLRSHCLSSLVGNVDIGALEQILFDLVEVGFVSWRESKGFYITAEGAIVLKMGLQENLSKGD